MRKISFRSFPSETVSVSVSQHGAAAEASFAPPPTVSPETTDPDNGSGGSGSTEGREVTIVPSRMTGTEPAGFFFEAIATGWDVESPFHHLRYKWSFDDPGVFTRMSETFFWRDRNVAYGAFATHIFEKTKADGTPYLVTCEVTDGKSEPVRGTVLIDVKSQDAVFTGRQTFCIDPLGRNDAEVPPGASLYTTFEDASKAAGALTGGAPLRLLFRRGTEVVTPAYQNLGNGRSKYFYGPYGSDPKPPVVRPATQSQRGLLTQVAPVNSAIQELTIWGLDIVGPYDAANPWDETYQTGGFGTGIDLGGAAVNVIWDCHVSGFKNNIYTGNGSGQQIFGNVESTNWHNFGVLAFESAEKSGMRGMSILQKPGTVGGAGKFEVAAPYYADHGPLRNNKGAARMSFQQLDMRSLNSWAGGIQPCIRFNGHNEPNVSAVFCCIREESSNAVSFDKYYIFNNAPQTVLVDKVLFLSLMDANKPIVVSRVGTEIRNVITVFPDTPKMNAKGQLDYQGGTPFLVGCNSDPTTYDAAAGAFDGFLRAYSCTVVDLRSFDTAREFELAQPEFKTLGFAEVAFDNWMIHVPRRKSATWGSEGPLDEQIVWDATTFDGIRWENDLFQPIFGVKPEAGALFAPQTAEQSGTSASPAAGGADESGYVALDDFFGYMRNVDKDGNPRKPSRGALEPDSLERWLKDRV